LLLLKGAQLAQSIRAQASIGHPPDFRGSPKPSYLFIQDEYFWLGLCIIVREWLSGAGTEVFVSHGPLNSGPGFEWFSDYVLAELDFVFDMVHLVHAAGRSVSDHLTSEANGRRGPLLPTWLQTSAGAEQYPR
jgi:hypothetical protein